MPTLLSEYGVDISITAAVVVPVEWGVYLVNMFLGDCYG
jgi:hypothetical protein